MKAAVYERYGPPEILELRDVPIPEPGPGRVPIRVVSVSVNRSDWESLVGRPAYVRIGGSGLFRPTTPILGSDIRHTYTTNGQSP